MDCPRNGTPYVLNLLSRRTFKVTSHTGISSSWIPLRIGVPQGLPWAPILFNLYIRATLKEFTSKTTGTCPCADDNTICIQTHPNESRAEFIHRTSSVVNSFEGTYPKMKCVPAKPKSVLIPFFQQFEGTEISGVPVKSCHRILEILVDSNRRFHKNSVEVLMKRRWALTWSTPIVVCSLFNRGGQEWRKKISLHGPELHIDEHEWF